MTLKACDCRENEQLIQELSIPAPGSQPLHFETRYPQSALSQFRLIFWKCAAPPCCPWMQTRLRSGRCSVRLDAVVSCLYCRCK